MTKFRRMALASLGCLSMLTLSACSLLPVEEEFRTAPLIRSYEREEFTLAFAERGDMELSTSISCTYMPVQTEILRYPVGGVYYDETFVKVGDSVRKGQLLAQLDMEGVQENVDNCRQQIETLTLRLSYLEENCALALERCRLQRKESTPSEREQALRQVEEQYDLSRQSLEDQLRLTRLRLAEYEQKCAERQLFAGLDGTVTYVMHTSPGQRSAAGDRFLTIADSTMSLFRADTEYWEYFQPGQEVTITVNKAEYVAVVTSEETLGLPVSNRVSGKQAYVYFVLQTPALDLEDGDRGKIKLVLDTRTDVLKVPEKAIAAAGEQPIVYYQDEEGMKAYKPVEIGLKAERMVEILSGLAEGDSVIIN